MQKVAIAEIEIQYLPITVANDLKGMFQFGREGLAQPGIDLADQTLARPVDLALRRRHEILNQFLDFLIVHQRPPLSPRKTHIPDILGKSDFLQYGFRLDVVSVQQFLDFDLEEPVQFLHHAVRFGGDEIRSFGHRATRRLLVFLGVKQEILYR